MNLFDVFTEDRKKRQIVDLVSSLPSNYIGGKRRLLIHIWDVLEKNQIKFDSVFDAFSGSSLVSLMFKKMGKKVYCNDLLTSSAITAVCLLELEEIPILEKDIAFLCKNEPKDHGTFVLDNYKNKFFTEKECVFLDKYKKNVETLCGSKFYCGLELLNKATLSSIPNSNFSVYGKDLKNIRSTHEIGKSFWTEKWRDTTRKRRDTNNEIMFEKSIQETFGKYKSAFSLFAIESHINQNCFLGGRYYNGQTLANLEHRLKHDKSKGKEIDNIPIKIQDFKNILDNNNNICSVFNSDIIELLESKTISADLIYIDPPFGGNSSDYAMLYRFLEEFLYEDKLENLEHIQKGSKRFCKTKGYQEQFEKLLSLCGNFPIWLLSYNDSSYASLDVIKSTIKNAGRSDIVVKEVPITYQYRKDKGEVDLEHFKDNDFEKKFSQRGTEYLILARK